MFSAPLAPIPANKASLQSWFAVNTLSFEKREADLDPALVTDEKSIVIIKVQKDGSGQFKTLTEAVKSIPKANTKRTIIWIGPGTYKKKVNIEKYQPFVKLYGDPKNMPTLTFDGTSKQYGTVFSGSISVYSKFSMDVNIIFENSSPMPKMGSMDGQAVALTLFEDNAALYNCRIPRHIITLGCRGVITSHGREKPSDDTGYAFVHCSISGVSNRKTYLGRLWKPFGKIMFVYTDMSRPGANLQGRVKFTKKLTDAEAKPYVDLNYIGAEKWLLPPPQVK
ncbi:hypothetical protein MKX01_027718 [Papaver californicum]|nr:hypothetical protein MKX01_027718 [Papaver californicum]